MSERNVQVLTQVEFDEADFPKAERIARRLGYTQTAYTSTSALWGLFCLPDGPDKPPHKRGGCIIKTVELGLMWVQDHEDLGMEDGRGAEELSADEGRQWARRTVGKAEVRK